MTKEQIKARSQEKVQLINNLLKELQVTIECRKQITPDMFIQDVAMYVDHEKYSVTEEKKEEAQEQAVE